MRNVLYVLGLVVAVGLPLCAQSDPEAPSVQTVSLAGPTRLSSFGAPNDGARSSANPSPPHGLVPRPSRMPIYRTGLITEYFGDVTAALLRQGELLVRNSGGDVIRSSRISQPAQSPDDAAWLQVERQSAGAEVRVVLGTGASFQGTFRQADDAAITLRAAERDQKLARVDVRQIWVVRDRDRWQHVVLGLAIGGAIGAVAVGLHCRGELPSCKEAAPVYFVPGVGLGAVVGAALPKRRVWQEVYLRGRG